MATDHRPLLADLRAEHDDLARLVTGADLDLPTPAEGWGVGATVAHLAAVDAAAVTALVAPEEFLATLPVVAADVDGFLQGQVEEWLAAGDLLVRWGSGFARLLEACGAVDPAVRVPWYGPPMSPASFVTARLMEYWAHGQDVVDGLGVEREPTDRLRHVARLGYATRAFAYRNRGLEPPVGEVRVELVGPDGSPWVLGPATGPADVVRGSALDWCLLVTQRRHRSDLDLVATGALADDWLDVAQAFAGPPGPGRAPLGR